MDTNFVKIQSEEGDFEGFADLTRKAGKNV